MSKDAVGRQRLINKALKLLSYRPRSIKEIRLRLERLKAEKELIDQVINRLVAEDLLNDSVFVQWWVNQRLTHRTRGNVGLRSELQRKGVDKTLIDEALLLPQQEKALAKKFLDSRLDSLRHLSLFKAKAKAASWLKARGFTYSTIRIVIDEIFGLE